MITLRSPLLTGLSLLLLAAGCGVGVEHHSKTSSTTPPATGSASLSGPRVSLPKAEIRFCTAAVILLDTSGSMLQEVRTRGGKRPKHEIARQALERIIDHTAEWTRSHADTQLALGIYQFSSSVSPLVELQPFDAALAQASLARIRPSSGTAIGRALETAFKALYASGCARKHILCITDGENTSGPSPEMMARAYFEASGGEVQMHFVAFDVAAKKFRFLEGVNGQVVEAADGEQLEKQLTEIYEKEILAEAPLEDEAAGSKVEE